MLNKYIVSLQTTRRGKYGDKQTKVQFIQYYAPTAKTAAESAEETRRRLTEKTGTEWTIEGVYVKCETYS